MDENNNCEGMCKKCGTVLSEENRCECEDCVCKECCSCPPDCSCGCKKTEEES